MTTMQFELWHVISLAVGFLGTCGAVAKFLLGQTQRHLDEKFRTSEAARESNHLQVQTRLDKMEVSARDDANGWARIERDLLLLKADLPLEYVRRDDYIRGQSVIESKLDSLAIKLENLQLRRQVAGGQLGA